MKNNEILTRIKDSLEIENEQMVEIFQMGDVTVSSEDFENMLIEIGNEDTALTKPAVICSNSDLEAFLNGFIVFKRGKKEDASGEVSKPALAITSPKSANNVMLKKLKIALSLSAEDMIDILAEVDVVVNKGDLSPLFRKEGHKHYKRCSDKFAIKFLKGLKIAGL